jgi:hypothetical protein
MFNGKDFPGISRHPRMQREAATFSAMIDISCSELHGTPRGELCTDCAGLLEYALLRLSKCPFQQGKTSCGACRVHCYKPDMRERARETMRTAGPRMPLRHPLMTFWHFLDGLRKEPLRKQ